MSAIFRGCGYFKAQPQNDCIRSNGGVSPGPMKNTGYFKAWRWVTVVEKQDALLLIG